MAATAPSTTSCAHSRSPSGVIANHAAGTATAATPSSTPVSTVLDLRAAAATCSPVRVTSEGGPSSTGETVSSGWPGARAKMSRPVMEPNVCRGTFAIRSATAGAAETATRTATNTATAIRCPGTSQYIRTRATAAAPKPAVTIAAAADQYRPVNRTISHMPASAVTAARKACGAPGGAAGRNRRGGQSCGDERCPRRAVGDDAACAEPCADRDGSRPGRSWRRRTGWAPATRFRVPTAAATAAGRPRRAHRR